MGDGTKENPYTREDVLRLIEEHGGTAKGLDLSGKRFEEGIDLHGLDLREIVLKEARLIRAHLEATNLMDAHLEGANLSQSHLEEANLQHVHLERVELAEAHLERALLCGANLEGTDLIGAHLEGADLSIAQLEGVDFGNARLQGAFLWGAKFSSDTDFGNVDWGNYILGDEKQQREKEEEREEFTTLWEVDNVYRRLKLWYTSAGMYDIAGEFYYREMEAKRKSTQRQIHDQFEKSKGWEFLRFLFKERDFASCVRLWIYRLTCGYGERPWRVVVLGISVLFGSALLYFFLRGVAPYTLTAEAFLASLYYSAVSFTALGYGPWFSASSVRSWVQGVGAAEAIIGVFMIALFLITFTRKMIR